MYHSADGGNEAKRGHVAQHYRPTTIGSFEPPGPMARLPFKGNMTDVMNDAC